MNIEEAIQELKDEVEKRGLKLVDIEKSKLKQAIQNNNTVRILILRRR